MPRMVTVTFLVVILIHAYPTIAEELDANMSSCSGLPINHFESRFPPAVKKLAFDHSMLEPFVELWRAGARPDLPRRPERVIIYALPNLPLVIGYQERDCIIAYLTVDSDILWRWLRPRLGWNV